MSGSVNGRDPKSQDRGPPQGVEAILLAAGRGVRLGSLTRSLPKVLLPVNGRPLLDYHLEALRSVGVRRVSLVVSYLADRVERHVDEGRSFGLDVVSVRQHEPLGTGDAVRVGGSQIQSDPFLVCYADIFVPEEASLLRELLADGEAKITGAQVPDAGGFGRLMTRNEGGELRLVGIREKDGQRSPGLVNAGYYLLPRSLLAVVADLPRSPRGEYELTDALVEHVRRGASVRVVPVKAWVDAGTPENLALANELARRNST